MLDTQSRRPPIFEKVISDLQREKITQIKRGGDHLCDREAMPPTTLTSSSHFLISFDSHTHLIASTKRFRHGGTMKSQNYPPGYGECIPLSTGIHIISSDRPSRLSAERCERNFHPSCKPLNSERQPFASAFATHSPYISSIVEIARFAADAGVQLLRLPSPPEGLPH